MDKAESSINYNPLMRQHIPRNRQDLRLMIQVMGNKYKQYNPYNQLSQNQSLYSNGLTLTDIPSERWTMEAQCGGMEPIGRSMHDQVHSWTYKSSTGRVFLLNAIAINTNESNMIK